MLAEMRTGSNFLEANLNALDGVICHGEAFNPHFIGKLNQTALFGLSLADRDADPAGFLRQMRKASAGLSGFRYFHDHDPRVLPLLLDDAECAKIILTRNPLESYVSWKIAKETGQWKLTNAKKLRTAKARFDGAEFEAHVADLQSFQIALLGALQRRGQTAFYIDYDDLQDIEVLNGLAGWLGVSARLEVLDPTLKKQNPEELADKVENPEAIAMGLARLDRFNLARTPNFEPRRAAAIPSFVAAGPLLHMPVKGGPEARVADWLAGIGRAEGNFTQKTLRQWMRAQPRHRCFAVLRHPLARAHWAFANKVLTGDLPEIRATFARTMQVNLPNPRQAETMAVPDHRDAFMAFLRFMKLNLSGQTALRVDAHLATQTAVIQGFNGFQAPDALLREDRLEEGLHFISAQAGIAAPPLPPAPPEGPVRLAQIADPALDDAAREAYARDYAGFGFTDWV